MKKYTFTLLILTIITAFAGFAFGTYAGVTVARFVFLVAFIGLFLSCLDAVIVSRRNRRMKRQANK